MTWLGDRRTFTTSKKAEIILLAFASDRGSPDSLGFHSDRNITNAKVCRKQRQHSIATHEGSDTEMHRPLYIRTLLGIGYADSRTQTSGCATAQKSSYSFCVVQSTAKAFAACQKRRDGKVNRTPLHVERGCCTPACDVVIQRAFGQRCPTACRSVRCGHNAPLMIPIGNAPGSAARCDPRQSEGM